MCQNSFKSGYWRILRGLHPEWRVAARAAGSLDVVLHLHLGRQREEAHECVVGFVDQTLFDAVTADAGETPFAVGRAEFGDEGVAVACRSGGCRGWEYD